MGLFKSGIQYISAQIWVFGISHALPITNFGYTVIQYATFRLIWVILEKFFEYFGEFISGILLYTTPVNPEYWLLMKSQIYLTTTVFHFRFFNRLFLSHRTEAAEKKIKATELLQLKFNTKLILDNPLNRGWLVVYTRLYFKHSNGKQQLFGRKYDNMKKFNFWSKVFVCSN